MKTGNITKIVKLPILTLACCASMPFALATETLLNGTTSTSTFGFTSFLDATATGSRAWSFRQDGAVLAPINTGGVLSTVTPVSVGLAGNADVMFGVGTAHAGVSGFSWAGLPDTAARGAMANGSGFHQLSSITIGSAAAIEGVTYHVELLAFGAFSALRSFDVAANGISRVDDWAIVQAPNYNHVLEFDVVANASGIQISILRGADGDANPYLSAMAITPQFPDTDMDGLPDYFEQLIINANPSDGIASYADVLPGDDFDGDSSTNMQEFARGTDPIDSDTDNDGYLDGNENGVGWTSATSTGTNPLKADTDGDGLLDGVENPDLPYVNATQTGTNPNLVDTDGDGLADGWEVVNSLDPTLITGEHGELGDPDGDSLDNFEEQSLGTNPRDRDTDHDGLSDDVETNLGYNSYYNEFDTGTDPLKADTDGDGLLDGIENPSLPYLNAGQPGTDPTMADSDMDGFNDNTEIVENTDPTNGNGFPAQAVVVSQWSFESNLIDTATGGVKADSLTDNAGGVSYVPGVIGNAVRIVSGKLTAVNSADLNLTGSWTMEAFIWRDANNLPSNEWERLWTKWGEGGSEYHWSIRGGNVSAVPDSPDLYINGNNNVINHDSTQTIPAEQWVHVALVGDVIAGTIRTYVNGVDVGGSSYTAITPTKGNMNFGNFIDSGAELQFSGYIDEAKIHEGAVSSAYLQSRVVLATQAAEFKILAFSHVPGTGSASITWSSVTGLTYGVEWSDDMKVWNILNNNISGVNGETSFVDTTVPTNASKRFYRVIRY